MLELLEGASQLLKVAQWVVWQLLHLLVAKHHLLCQIFHAVQLLNLVDALVATTHWFGEILQFQKVLSGPRRHLLKLVRRKVVTLAKGPFVNQVNYSARSVK